MMGFSTRSARPTRRVSPTRLPESSTLPEGCKPFRSVVDAARAGVDHVMAFSDLAREVFVRRLGFEEVLELKR